MLYAALAYRGFFPVEELLTFRQLNSRLQGHPDPQQTAGDRNRGRAAGARRRRSGWAWRWRTWAAQAFVPQRPLGRASAGKTYVILGRWRDQRRGDLGRVMAAAKYRLGNLTAILDYNGIQQTGATADVMPTEPIADKWEAFGWHVQEIHGHNVGEILNALDRADEVHARPSVIIARTTKGKGVSFMEYDHRWHGMSPNKEQYEGRPGENWRRD